MWKCENGTHYNFKNPLVLSGFFLSLNDGDTERLRTSRIISFLL